MNKMKYNNYPVHECMKEADRIIAAGGRVFQKFTCAKCGERQTMEKPNTFYATGKCEECQHITDIRITGCNYMVDGPADVIMKLMQRGEG